MSEDFERLDRQVAEEVADGGRKFLAEVPQNVSDQINGSSARMAMPSYQNRFEATADEALHAEDPALELKEPEDP